MVALCPYHRKTFLRSDEDEKTVQEKRFDDIGKMLYYSESTEKSRKHISGNEQQGRKVFI